MSSYGEYAAMGALDSPLYFVVKLIDVFPDDYKYPEGAKPPEGSAACVFDPLRVQCAFDLRRRRCSAQTQ